MCTIYCMFHGITLLHLWPFLNVKVNHRSSSANSGYTFVIDLGKLLNDRYPYYTDVS